MKQLTEENRQLVNEYSWVVPVAYKKLHQIDELAPYKDEILSEGYYAICLASSYYREELKDEPFSYFFKCAQTRMYEFIREFIHENSYISLDQSVCEDSEIRLIDLIYSHYKEPLINDYIDDILDEYRAQVLKDKSMSVQSKNYQTSDAYVTKLRHILTMLDQGYNGVEIGVTLGVSKQVVNTSVRRLVKQLSKSYYKE